MHELRNENDDCSTVEADLPPHLWYAYFPDIPGVVFVQRGLPPFVRDWAVSLHRARQRMALMDENALNPVASIDTWDK